MNINDECAEVTVDTGTVGVKKEESAPNNDYEASMSPSRSSPEPGCPICLGKLENKSFTDSCLHQFCFKCLLEWSKVKAECPLCKQSFKSIIHNVRSIEDYEQYYLNTTSSQGTINVSLEWLESTPPSNYREPSNYRFRTTAVSSYLDYFVRLEEAISHRVLPPGPTINGGVLWQRRRQRGTSDFRRNIYQQGLWVQRTSDITGRVRECSPEFYRENPAQVHRLVPWLNRELNVLLYENSPHIQHVMSRILELITQVPIRSPAFASVIGPYIGRHTEHFIHEFHSFALSPFDLVGYDRHANYVGHSEIVDYETPARGSDSDSDVQVLEEGVQAQSPLIQLVDTDSDDCIVLDAPVRTEPEVITLDSDDDDVVQISIQTCQPSLTTSNEPSTSTSQPKPSISRRPRLKRNWLTVSNVQVPTTSTSGGVNGCEISISIAHSSRSTSPSVSNASSASWVPVRRKPTKVKKKKEMRKRKCYKGKTSKFVALEKDESDDESSPGPRARRRKTPTALVSSSSSESVCSSRTHIFDDKLSSAPVLSSIFSESERMFVATDSDTSSDETQYKPRLRSVVVKTTNKSEHKDASPTLFTPHYRSESYDHDSAFSSHSYLGHPGSSRSRSNSYRSSYSHHSHCSNSSSVERQLNKCCKHSKKRSKRDRL